MRSPKNQKVETFTSTGDRKAEQRREARGVTRATGLKTEKRSCLWRGQVLNNRERDIVGSATSFALSWSTKP